MNDVQITRPKVTKVKVSVKKTDPNSENCSHTEIIITADQAINSDNFNFKPKLIFGPDDEYQITGDPEFNTEHHDTVLYTEENVALETRIIPIVDVELEPSHNAVLVYETECG